MRGPNLLNCVASLAAAALHFTAHAADVQANKSNGNAPKQTVAALNSQPESPPPSKPVEATPASAAPANGSISPETKIENGDATPIKISGSVAAKPVDDPALPARIPGYELRVLDVRKDVFFRVNGTWVQTAVPVYFYFPANSADRARGIELLRQARSDARKLGQVSSEKSPELDRVIASLDEALAALENQP